MTRLSDSGYSTEITTHRRLVLFSLGVFSLVLGAMVYVLSSRNELRQENARLKKQLQNCSSTLQREIGHRDELVRERNWIYRLLQEQTGSRTFEISRARYDRDALYIEVKKRKGRKLDIGSILVVVDSEDNKSMGYFEITEVRSETYYARGINNTDPVWLGYVRDKGESSIMPYLQAIHARGVENDE